MADRAPARRDAPVLLLGVGLGAFVDGIVLHQVLQWHHLVSDVPGRAPGTLEGLRLNTLADGLFHAAAWVLVLAATVLLVRQWRRGEAAPSTRATGGSLLVGWGAFNLVEGLVDHHLLGVHHVRDDLGGPLAWDVGFLLVSLALVGLGLVLRRRPG